MSRNRPEVHSLESHPPKRLGRILPAAVLLIFAANAAAAAAVPTPRDAETIARDYVEANLEALGLTAEDAEDLVVTDSYVSRHTGTTHVFLRQRIDGIEVFNSSFNVAISRGGNVAHVGDRFVSGLADVERRAAPSLSAAEAVELAAAELGLDAPKGLKELERSQGRDRQTLLSAGSIALEDIPARLVYQRSIDGRMRLAWDLEIYQLDASHWWSVRVDAATGELLDVLDYVDSESYEIYPLPIESPHHTTPLPPADARSVVVDPYLDGAGSPFGWHDTDGTAGAEFTITRGNTVHAYADTNNDNMPDVGGNAEPDGGAGLDFTGATVPIDLGLDPSAYTQASIANLFYWSNIIHDVAYEYGFDEAAGNFQVDNYGNGGEGDDDVRAEAQDGGGNCNANFGTPPDGSRPRMQMYLCANVSPRRDGSLDHGVVIHEYGHGISNRLTGGPGNVGCLGNQEQMGEGWGDYLGMMFTQEPGRRRPPTLAVSAPGSSVRGRGAAEFVRRPTAPTSASTHSPTTTSAAWRSPTASGSSSPPCSGT